MIPWPEAWRQALYGPDGFYRRPEGPAGHFRTASHAAPAELGGAIARLADRLRAGQIVDVGAGRGELLTSVPGDFEGRARWGVDIVGRPPHLPERIGWAAGLENLPVSALNGALVIAWELLDVVPLTICEPGGTGAPVTQLVDPGTGRERPGRPPTSIMENWIRDWWPVTAETTRIEVGLERDLFWRGLIRHAQRHGARAALCVDYAHTTADRPPDGSLTGFRRGRAVPPVPDGTMDLTAHVAIDSLAAASGFPYELTTQAQALADLGVTGRELLDPGGLGGFAWLLQVF